MIKANKAKVQKKDAKKTVKKDLEKSLTQEFLEVVKRLGHDAVHVAADISKASKLFAKKLTKAIATPKDTSKKKPEVKSIKEEIPKGVLKARKALKKASKTSNPIIQSVKVSPILSEEKAASAIKPKVSQEGSESKSLPKSNKEEPKPTKAVAVTKTSAPSPAKSVSETKSKTPRVQTTTGNKKLSTTDTALLREKAEDNISPVAKSKANVASARSKETPVVKKAVVKGSSKDISTKEK
jgi:hypothetical protein